MTSSVAGAAIAGPFPDYVARGGAGAVMGSGGGGFIMFIAIGAVFYGGISVIANLSIILGGIFGLDKDRIASGALGLWRTFVALAVIAAVVLGISMAIGWLGSLFQH